MRKIAFKNLRQINVKMTSHDFGIPVLVAETFLSFRRPIRKQEREKTADERGAVEAFCRSIELADQQ